MLFNHTMHITYMVLLVIVMVPCSSQDFSLWSQLSFLNLVGSSKCSRGSTCSWRRTFKFSLSCRDKGQRLPQYSLSC